VVRLRPNPNSVEAGSPDDEKTKKDICSMI